VHLEGVGAILDRRLRPESRRPVAVAFSGGGDSLALLLAADAWAETVGRELLVLTVDHRLQPDSEAWTEACAATAERLGMAFQPLAWTGEKPTTGLSAAARAARHRLLADAARAAGASVVLMGHTADDILEARLMRTRGSTASEPREWSPSPAWPEGRGVFLLRPLLGLRRAGIRDWLVARGERWIDDPANESPLSLRAQARRAIGGGGADPGPTSEPAAAAPLARACRPDAAAGLHAPRRDIAAAAPGVAARFLSAACLCAAGTSRPPPREAALRLAERLAGPDGFVTTLAGARIEADGETVRFLREAGEAARGGLRPLILGAGETAVWDGRFEITAARAMEVRAALGLRQALSPADQDALVALSAGARDTVPVVVGEDGPRLAVATPMALERLLAACGAVEIEPI
jgi:tRNA(Ile)-lysidine synthase